MATNLVHVVDDDPAIRRVVSASVPATSLGPPDGSLDTPGAVGMLFQTDRGAVGTLSVSQTRELARDLNAAITTRLAASHLIEELQPLEAWAPRDTLRAEKLVPDPYQPGTVLRFNRAYGALARGELATVLEVSADQLALDVRGTRHHVSLRHGDRWDLLEPHPLYVGRGSLLQLRSNGRTAAGQSFTNGERVIVERLDACGLHVRNGEKRVRRRFEEHGGRSGQRVAHRGVVRRDEAHLDPARLEMVTRDRADARVAVVGRHQHVTRPHRGLERRVDRGHAGAEQHDVGALELGQRPLVEHPGRVAVAVVAADVADLAGEVERRPQRRPRQERRAPLGRGQARVGSPGARPSTHVARGHDSNPCSRWALSQNGFVCDLPQRHRTIEPSSGSSNALPSASISRIGPVTL